MGHLRRTVYGWPSFLAIGVRQLVRSNAYDVAVLSVPFIDLPVAQSFHIPKDVV